MPPLPTQFFKMNSKNLQNKVFYIALIGVCVFVLYFAVGGVEKVFNNFVSSVYAEDGGDGPSSDGTAVGTSADSTSVGTSADGASVGTSPDGTAVGTSADGVAVGTSPDGTAVGTSGNGVAVGTSSDSPSSSSNANTDSSPQSPGDSFIPTPPPSPVFIPPVILPPTVDVKANGSDGPIEIPFNTQATISWTSQNATTCFVSPINGFGLSGSLPSGHLTATRTFTATCFGAGGTAVDRVTVNVRRAPPTVDVVANPHTIFVGETATVSFHAENADTCTASGGWSGTTRQLSGSTTVSPSEDTTYTMTCRNASGEASDSDSIHVTQRVLPTVDLNANPHVINQGQSAILTWTSHNATTCIASGGWSGNRPLSGTETVTPTVTTSFSIQCSNQFGSAFDSDTVSVRAPNLPTVTIRANPRSILQGESSTLTWNSQNATTCVASNGWLGSRPLSGTEVVRPNTTTTFTVTCSNEFGQAQDSDTVFVGDRPLELPRVTLRANPNRIMYGNSSVLTWNSQNATSCFASNGWSGTKSLSGNETVSPTTQTTYTITCSNNRGTAQDSDTVFVDYPYTPPPPYNPPPYNPPPYYPPYNPPSSYLNGTVITKTVRNITTHEQFFQSNTEAQGLDMLEFELRLRNTNNFNASVTVRDFLPSELFYVTGSTRLGFGGFSGNELSDGSTMQDGITNSNLSLNLQPYEERVIRFRSVVYSGTPEKTIINQGTVTTTSYSASGALTSQSNASVTIRNRGRVLGVGTVITGPENILPWTLGGGFLGALLLYGLLFRFRYRGKTFSGALADMRLQRAISRLKRKEITADTLMGFEI